MDIVPKASDRRHTEFPNPVINNRHQILVRVNQPISLHLLAVGHHGLIQILAVKEIQIVYWDQSPEQIFQKSKEKIIAMIQDGVRSFEKDRATCLSRDLSKTGIGFTLTQKYCNFVNKSGTESWNPNCGKDTGV